MAKGWRRESLTWGKRLVLVVIIMVAVLYGLMGLAQRSPESLRKGLEDYLSKATGHVGEITDLSEARLMPDVVFRMADVNVRDAKDPDKIYIHADSAYAVTPFWRMVFGAGGFSAFEIRGLETASGYFLPLKLVIDYAGISDPEPAAQPQAIIEGRYNNLPLLVTMEMIRKSGRKGLVYTFAGNSMTTFKLGGTEGEGVTTRHFSSVSLQAARLKKDGMQAEFTAENIHSEPLNMTIKGTVDEIGFNATLTGAGEDILLKITPETNDPDGIRKIKDFTDAVGADLGLTDENSNIRVEITGLSAGPSSEETLRDSKE